MLKTPQCPGVVSGWLLSFLWPLVIVGLMLAIHAAVSTLQLTDEMVWGFTCLVVGAAISKPLHHVLTRLNDWLSHPQNPYGCPHCGFDIHDTPHRCPQCKAKLLWGEVPDALK